MHTPHLKFNDYAFFSHAPVGKIPTKAPPREPFVVPDKSEREEKPLDGSLAGDDPEPNQSGDDAPISFEAALQALDEPVIDDALGTGCEGPAEPAMPEDAENAHDLCVLIDALRSCS